MRHPSALTIILAQRLWQAGSGLITIVLVTRFLSPTEQGWYYSLLSFAALYTLFDLGLSYALLQAAAQTFVGLTWRTGGRFEGTHTDQFEALAAWSARHYMRLSLGFFAIVTPAGFALFGYPPSPLVSWQLPWLALSGASGATLLLLPFVAIVEGSGRVTEVYSIRLIQGVVAAIACWIALFTGAGLWVVVVAPFAAAVTQCAWLAKRKPFLLSLAWQGSQRRINWRREIWPHQWQIGLAWLSGYLLTQIYTLVLLKTQDAIVAGQMGLTLTASNMLGLLAQSWITRHVPAMARAATLGKWDEFEGVFRRDLILSSLAFLGGGLALSCAYWLLSDTSFVGRLLPFWPFAGVLAVGFMGHLQNSLAAQLRSFRREPLLWVSIAGAILTMAGAFWGAIHYSASGVVVAMLTVQAVAVLPMSIAIWRQYRRNWRTSVGRDRASPDYRNPDLEPVVLPGLDA